MANLFKPTYTKTDPETGERVTRRLRKWYGKFRDANGTMQCVPLSTDKTAAQAMLTDLIRKAEREKGGLTDRIDDQLGKTVESQVAEFKVHLEAKNRSDSHISETIRLVTRVTRECGMYVLRDMQSGAELLQSHLAERLHSGAAHRTVNADLTAIRSFCRWLLHKKRMRKDPTAGLNGT